MNKTRIAYPVCVFPPYKGGIGNAAFNIAQIMSDKSDKYDITVIAPEYGIGSKEQAKKFPFIVKRLKPFFKFGNAALLPRLKQELQSYDIVHLHYPFYGAAEFVLLAKKAKPSMKILLHYHMDTEEKGVKGAIFKFYRRFILPGLLDRCEAITCASIDYIQNSYIKDYYFANPEKFREISFGVDLEKFKPFPRPTTSKKNILFVGGLDKAHDFKGLEYLINAFSLLTKTDQNLSLTIVGSGDRQDYYQKQVKLNKIENKVIFKGSLNDEELNHQYNSVNVLTLPSINKNEAFGLVLLEAMACNLPVIASDLPGVRSVFREGIDGLVSRPKDADDLAAKISQVLASDQNRYGATARDYVLKKYTWEKVGENLDDLYQKIIR